MASGFWDALLGGFGDAIADVRSKLIDEGWFGRTDGVAPEPAQTSEHGLYGPPRTFDKLWAPRAPDDAVRGPERDAPGIDR